MSKKQEFKNNILAFNKTDDILWALSNELDWVDLTYILEVLSEDRLESIKDNLQDLREARKLGKNGVD